MLRIAAMLDDDDDWVRLNAAGALSQFVGDVDEASILITLQLTPRDAAQEPITLQNIVPFLEPDEATTVSFDLTNEVIPGSLYELQAMASIAEDADLDNNEWELVFLRNAP